MANTTVVKVTVEELTKFGYKANGRFVNYSKQLSEKDKALVVPGASFEAEYYVADSGKEYLNKIVASDPKVKVSKVVAKPVVTKESVKEVKEIVAKHFPKLEDKSGLMSKAEWAAKDRSQLIGGLSHDAAAITAAFAPMSPDVDTEGALKLYKDLLVGMLKIRDEVK